MFSDPWKNTCYVLYLDVVQKGVGDDPKFMFFDMFMSRVKIECVVMYTKIITNARAPDYLNLTVLECGL